MKPFYKIEFINEHFVMVDKAPMVLSVPARLNKLDQRPCLGHLLENDLKQIIYPVHRLDYEVSGLIIFALTIEAQKAANDWFSLKTIKKNYCAITLSSGKFQIEETYEWKSKLLRGKKRAYESAVGKDALTYATLKKTYESGQSEWDLSPITGRSHQLRYELFSHGEVIIGDRLYGSTLDFEGGGIALKSYKIDFSKTSNFKLFSLPESICLNKF